MGSGVAGKASGSFENIGTRFFSRQRVLFTVATEAVFYFLVAPLENRTGLLVIEILRIKIHDRCILPLMLCMTDNAILSFIAVVSSIISDANGDFLMTGQAFGGRHFEILVVTLAAIFYARRFLMSRAQFSRRIIDIELLLCLEKEGLGKKENNQKEK
jgi:hypothetical protein